jgi:hypothetical protein
MTADRLIAGLERVRRTGPGRYVARCPAHKDRTASLSIRELDDGRVLVHCFASCLVTDVVAAAGVTMEDLFPPRTATAGSGQRAERRPFSVRDLMDALASELGVAWVLLADLAAGREIVPKDRERAALARDRCAALVEELRHVR